MKDEGDILDNDRGKPSPPDRAAFLDSVFSSSLDGIFIVDRRGRYVDVNPAGCEQFGYTREEMLSSSIDLLIFPEDVEAGRDNLEKIFNGTMEGGKREIRLRRKDGSEIWVELTVNTFTVGGADYALGIKRDITESRKLKGELLEAKAGLEAKVAEKTGAVCRVNDTLHMIIKETSSVTGEEFLRSLSRNLASALKCKYALVGELCEDGASVTTHVLWAEGGFADNFNYELEGTPCANVIGRELCLYSRGVAALFPEDKILADMGIESYIGVPLFASDGAPLGILVAMDDKPMKEVEFSKEIMNVFALRASFELERKRYDEKLTKSREMLQSIIDNSATVIYMKDADGRYILSNRLHQSIMRMGQDALVGKTVYDVFPKELADSMTANDEKVRNGGVPVECEDDILHPDGTIRTYLSVKFPLPGYPGAVCGISTDITDRKKLETELFKAQKLDSLGVLAGGLAHDFNNLLLGILGNVSVALNYITPGEKAATVLTEVEKAALRAKDLTKKLLTFSRGGAPVKEPAPIDTLLKDSASLLLRGSNVEAEYSMDEGLPMVEIDEGQIAQVMNNIILNAVQAMPRGGVLRFSASQVSVSPANGLPVEEGDYVRISVKDSGPGLTPEVLARIFDPFFTTKKKASGLGLSLSYSIVKRHGGLLRAESTAGKGTEVQVYLPAFLAEPEPSAAPEPLRLVSDEPGAVKGRVLVMDDEEMIRDLAAEMLELLGYEAECAEEGGKAIELFKESRENGRPFDAVILDLTVVDGMGGLDTMAKLLEIDPEVKAIVSSGYSQDPILSEYGRHGFVSVIAKPYRVTEFSSAVKAVLER